MNNKERIKILYGDIVVKDQKKEVKINEAVFREDATHYKKKEIIKVLSFKCVGYVSKLKEYTEVKKNEEIRNKITGAYE